MTINEFIGSDEMMTEHIVRRYASFEEKEAMAKGIAKQTYYANGDDSFKKNSAIRYVLERLALISLYTDLQLGDSPIRDYDLLFSSDAFEILEEQIGDSELAEFKCLVELECQDIEFNEYDIHAYISKQVEKFVMLTEILIKSIID